MIIGLPLDSTRTLLNASKMLLTNVSHWAVVVNLERGQNLLHNNYMITLQVLTTSTDNDSIQNIPWWNCQQVFEGIFVHIFDVPDFLLPTF